MCKECEQLQQLAGCGAALGEFDQVTRKGDYDRSPSYQDVLDLRWRYEAVCVMVIDYDPQIASEVGKGY